MTAATAGLTTVDMILVAQEMEAASRKYLESADRLLALEETPGQFANAISGQRHMAHECAEIARRAKALRGFESEAE